MIVILDYDMGNVASILNMLHKIGEKAIISRDHEIINYSDKIILPGVGNYDMGMEQLNKYDLINAIRNHALEKNKPLLGICLGMQLLGRKSEEGKAKGLGLIPFDVVKFKFNTNLKQEKELKIPHMGWNYVKNLNTTNLNDGLDVSQRYYFVHSYHALCDSSENILMTCQYGYEFIAGVKEGNIYGVQFHPEKSHSFGMKLLKNFAKKV